jgi:proline dehydrogenase
MATKFFSTRYLNQKILKPLSKITRSPTVAVSVRYRSVSIISQSKTKTNQDSRSQASKSLKTITYGTDIATRSVGTAPSSNSNSICSSPASSTSNNVNSNNNTLTTTHLQTSTYSSSSSGKNNLTHQLLEAGNESDLRPRSVYLSSFVGSETAYKEEEQEEENASEGNPVIDFNNTKIAFSGTSTAQLIRAYFVFKLCGVRPLVENSDILLKFSYQILGSTITEAVIRHSFFNHFCAGETSSGINPIVNKLYQSGVGSILDYAAEADVSEDEKEKSNLEEKELSELKAVKGLEQNIAIKATGRIYDYESERKCDHHVDIFRQCIEAVKDNNPDGFAAIKVTALGNPILLERMSICISEIRNLFVKMDVNQRGYLTIEEFISGYKTYFLYENKEDEKIMYELIERLDPRKKNKIDYIEWIDKLTLLDDEDINDDMPAKSRDSSSISSVNNNIILSKLITKCKESGPLAQSILDAEEVELLKAMIRRLENLAKTAKENNVRLMVDAEQSYFQPAIDNMIVDLQRRYNSERPIIYTTYQCYLKDSMKRLQEDLKRTRREDYYFAAKLVRGAYMVSERARAEERGYESPIHESLETTHNSYDACVKETIEAIASKSKAEVLIATHNQRSVEYTLDLMQRYKLHPKISGVYFGQLLGMCDHLTLLLGKHGYNANKYVPYGPVGEVIPYLIRRAQENASMFADNNGKENGDIALVKSELKRRFFA